MFQNQPRIVERPHRVATKQHTSVMALLKIKIPSDFPKQVNSCKIRVMQSHIGPVWLIQTLQCHNYDQCHIREEYRSDTFIKTLVTGPKI
ncbi:MAG: hypothetical protein CMH95_06000 [Oceanospirillaceae bacterium]|nr:hypothetical protein [Oceanospirillaceae bacterium]MAG43828.1 hypothetical protein [Oceanospirillaceae bacterium]MAX87081.1 hypothetical protein [Oceanospirillaceae bacterium]